MEKFKELINVDELNKLLKKDKLTLIDERFKIDSVTPHTLVDVIGDLRNEELNEVYFLEAKNIYKVINVAAMILGVYGKEQEDNIMKIPDIQRISVEIINTTNTIEAFNEAFFFLSARCLLALKSSGHNVGFKPVFDGKIPNKMFALRQTAAEIWFDDYTKFVLGIAAKIYARTDADAENAFQYICYNTAWYLNKSQTFRYYRKSTDNNMEDTIIRILKEFLTIAGGSTSQVQIINHLSAPLYKDL